MLNHLMQYARSFGPHQCARLPWLIARGKGVDTPHSTSARGYDNLHYHSHDLVAISMGTGGWVFKIKSRLNPARVLEPKCHSCDICGQYLQGVV